MNQPADRRPPRPSQRSGTLRRLSLLPGDLWLALAAGGVVALGAGVGHLADGSEGALTGTIIGFAVCVFVFTVSTLVWATGTARHYRDSTRRRR